MIEIDEVDDDRLGDYRRLSDPEYRTALESEQGVFVAEGVFVIERLLASDLQIRSLMLTRQRYERLEGRLGRCTAPVYVADQPVMEGIVGFPFHRGALAIGERPPPAGVAEVVSGARLVCVLEGIGDHENLGAILRSADALGVDAVVLDPTCADPWYRRSVRVSMGAVFSVPMARARSWPDDIASLDGCSIAAMTVSRAARPVTDLESGRWAVLLGAEGPGLSQSARSIADVEVTIPMREGVDSLNVAHAAAIAFHHLGVR